LPRSQRKNDWDSARECCETSYFECFDNCQTVYTGIVAAGIAAGSFLGTKVSAAGTTRHLVFSKFGNGMGWYGVALVTRCLSDCAENKCAYDNTRSLGLGM
jgi:hypothetical protein